MNQVYLDRDRIKGLLKISSLFPCLALSWQSQPNMAQFHLLPLGFYEALKLRAYLSWLIQKEPEYQVERGTIRS